MGYRRGIAARFSRTQPCVTGMVIGSAFTLFVVPSIYVLVAGTRKVTVSAEAGEEVAHPEYAGAAG